LEVPEDLPGSLIFPISALLHWPVEGYSAFRAIVDAAAAVPAFIRVQDDRWFAFFRVGDKGIDLAVFHTGVTAVTKIGIVNQRISRTDNIG
jgi:hypothetical protein